jgi:large subunit ribosomal protein L35
MAFKASAKAIFMRRPKGIKTKKSVAKRFKISARGKVLARHSGMRHLLSGKSSKRRRRLGKEFELSPRDVYKIKACLPTSH